MGTYVTNQNVIDRIGTARAAQLTTDSGTTPNTALIDAMIDEAEGEAHGYIAKRYDVPVDLTEHADLAATLRGFVISLVLERLERDRRPPVSEDIRRGRDAAIDWFGKIAEGKINLPSATTPPSTNADDPATGHGNYRADPGVEDML